MRLFLIFLVFFLYFPNFILRSIELITWGRTYNFLSHAITRWCCVCLSLTNLHLFFICVLHIFMEEREKSLLDEKDTSLSHGDNAIPIPSPAPNRTGEANPASQNDPPSVSSRPAFHSGTYVVQVPKDQIYRVPPPENALMVAERTRNQDKQRRSSCCFCSCSSCILKLVIIYHPNSCILIYADL